MKKLFLPLIALLVLSCSDEDEPVMMSVNSQITMTREENKFLTISGADASKCNIYSDNTFVAEVSGTYIDAKHVGEANIIVSYNDQRDTCKLNVTPVYSLFKEPITDFSLTISQLRNIETDTHFGTVEPFSGYGCEMYSTTNPKIANKYYMFMGTQFYMSRVDLYKSACSMIDLTNFLVERYEFQEFDGAYTWYKKGMMYVCIYSKPSLSYYSVYYSESDDEITYYSTNQ